MKLRYLLFLSVVLLSYASYASYAPAPEPVTALAVQGLEGALEKNVDAYLATISPRDYSSSLRFRALLKQQISRALNALGYYQPRFRFSFDSAANTLTVKVDPGPPLELVSVDIRIEGEAEQDQDFQQLLSEQPLKPGSGLDHGQYEGLKSAIRNLALGKGYFDGRFTRAAVEVSPALNQGFVYLHYQSGERYRFGPTQLSGSQITAERVLSMQPYRIGDPYQAELVGQFNQRLASSDWFSSVLVQPDMSLMGQQTSLPILVDLQPQARNLLETGIGYATDVGVRASLSWKKPWLNEQGHSFESSLSLSNPEQALTFSYKIPLQDVLNDYYRVKYGVKQVIDNDTDSLEANLALERHWLLDSGWHRTVALRYLLENFDQGLQSDSMQMLLPGVTYSSSKTSGGMMPMQGSKYSFTIEAADARFGSESSVVRGLASATWLDSLGENQRGLARLDLRANLLDEITGIPPSLRFFAGGDNSLRGYDYQSISPRDSSGALIGASYLATSSLEYQYRLYGNWWGAAFVDYGDAWSRDTPEGKTGVGGGIRWVSPVGPLRLDLAWGLDNEAGDRFRIHFTLGPEI